MTTFDDYRPRRRIMTTYRQNILDLVEQFLPVTLRGDTPSNSLLNLARAIARTMYQSVVHVNTESWRAAAARVGRGPLIADALRVELEGPLGITVSHWISENAALISSLPYDLADEASRYAFREYAKGIRHEEVAKVLRARLPELVKWKVDRIARTESSKAETALTRSRSEAIGLKWYQWATVEDERVRPSHEKLDLVLVAWTDPPAPEQLVGIKSKLGHYHAGNAPNCRCTPLPIVDYDEIAWPARVYAAGRITTMSLANFRRVNRLPAAA